MSKPYTPQQVAERLGVTTKTLRNWEDAGKIAPADRTEGDRRIYSEEAVALMEAAGLSKKSKEQEVGGAVVIAVVNHKGGSAKTTSVINLAGVLALEKNKRVLIVDMDSQANCTIGLGFSPYNLQAKQHLFISDVILPRGETLHSIRDAILSTHYEGLDVTLDIVPSSLNLSAIETNLIQEMGGEGLLSDILAPVLSQYDIVLIDCPPSLGVYTTNALWAADYVLIPVEAANYAVAGLTAITSIVNKVRTRAKRDLNILGVFNTRVPSPLTNSAKEALENTKRIFAKKYIDVQISNAVASERAVEEGVPMVISNSRHKVTEEYRQLADEVLARVD